METTATAKCHNGHDLIRAEKDGQPDPMIHWVCTKCKIQDRGGVMQAPYFSEQGTRVFLRADGKMAAHPFEAAGLGEWPFTCYSIFRGPPSGCDLCGTYIREWCMIRDRKGITFKVGNDCVGRTGDNHLKVRVKALRSELHAKLRKEKKAIKDQAAADAQKLTAEAKKVEFLAIPENAALIATLREKAVGWNSGFLVSLLYQFDIKGTLSDRQLEAARNVATKIAEARIKADAEAVRSQKAEWVGKVGEKITFEAEIRFVKGFDGHFGTSYLHILRTAEGNTITYLGTKYLPTGKDVEEARGMRVRMTAKVKEQVTNQKTGERETRVSHPSNIEILGG